MTQLLNTTDVIVSYWLKTFLNTLMHLEKR